MSKSLQIDGGLIEMYTYLGSAVSCDGEILEDIKCRIVKVLQVVAV